LFAVSGPAGGLFLDVFGEYAKEGRYAQYASECREHGNDELFAGQLLLEDAVEFIHVNVFLILYSS
jgi:hypothetical protein